MTQPPPGLARHLDGEPLELHQPAARSRLIGRLLEEGDRAELAWLGSEVSRDELAAWFRAHGGRRLSRRSRAFWSAVLAQPLPSSHPLAEALWPLA
jgi:hypothetical protein